MRNRRGWAALALAAWFLLWSAPGLAAYFAADDMMNLYFGWTTSWTRHLKDNALFFTGALRPLGNVFYKATFDFFGLNPAPYRVVCFALLLLNLWLSYAVALQVSRSEVTSFLAALMAAYHAPLMGIYHATAVVYDILAFLFFFAAFLAASRRRWVWLTGALFVCALNSKEIAVVLPVVLAAYEWFCEQDRRWKWVVWMSVIALVWVVGKLLVSESMLANPAYRPSLVPAVWMDHLKHYLRLMVCLAWNWPVWGVALLVVLVVLGGWLSRNGAARWATVLIFAGTLPILGIDLRSYYVLYIAHLGWAVFLAALLTRLPKPWIVTAIAALLLVPLHIWATPRLMGDVSASQNYVRPALEQLKAQQLSLPKSSRVLFLEDPYPEDDWILTFIIDLLHKDKTIAVDRAKRMDHTPTDAELASYAAVFRLENDRLTRLR